MRRIGVMSFVVLMLVFVVGCDNEVVQPKPSGYYRIDLPSREYKQWKSDCPFEFKVSNQSEVLKSKKNNTDCYFDLTYPDFNASIYLSYLPVNKNLKSLVDQEYDLREKHNAFSTGVSERLYKDEQNKVSAMMFDLKGFKAATPLQFFITDSINHFFTKKVVFTSKVFLVQPTISLI